MTIPLDKGHNHNGGDRFLQQPQDAGFTVLDSHPELATRAICRPGMRAAQLYPQGK
jgi:hypothetical protein